MLLTSFLILMLLFAVLLLFVVYSSFIGFVLTRVPFVPTNTCDIEYFVKKLGISSNDVFYELGSGDGRVVLLVNKLTGARCVGFELTWWTHLWAKFKIWTAFPRKQDRMKNGKELVDFRNKNFFKYSWDEADYIYAYLYPPLMDRVEEKFLADCKSGSVAIIRDFPFPNLKPSEVYRMPRKHEIYIYKKYR